MTAWGHLSPPERAVPTGTASSDNPPTGGPRLQDLWLPPASDLNSNTTYYTLTHPGDITLHIIPLNSFSYLRKPPLRIHCPKVVITYQFPPPLLSYDHPRFRQVRHGPK